LFREVLDEYMRDAERDLRAARDVAALTQEKTKLTEELARLKLDIRQQKLELEHKVGLHVEKSKQTEEIAEERRKSMEANLNRTHDVAVREAKVEAREEAMIYADEILNKHMARMEGIVDTLVEALPSAKIIAQMGRAKED
jgi:hypothetical protein